MLGRQLTHMVLRRGLRLWLSWAWPLAFFKQSTIWTTQMSTVMGRGNSNLHFSRDGGKGLLLVLPVGVIIDC